MMSMNGTFQDYNIGNQRAINYLASLVQWNPYSKSLREKIYTAKTN